MKEIPISKIYEALSAIADNRVEKTNENTFIVLSSDRSKGYTIIKNGDTYSSNDNATVWQHYAGYPIVSVLLYEGRVTCPLTLLEPFVGIDWHSLNKKNKNDYDASIKEAFASLDKTTQETLQKACLFIKSQVESLPLAIKGNRKPLIKP